MKILITGAAGFIGSHLAEHLLRSPQNFIVGLDALLGDQQIKRQNLKQLLRHPRFQFIEANLLHADLKSILQNVDAVYHLAGMPGVRSSWGPEFEAYTANNILATQKLLEACRGKQLNKFIFASTSSVYGEKHGAVSELAFARPLSPYGVSKLSAEHLCKVYQKSERLPLVILRYFTVYGPRQRPDMAFHRFIRQALDDQPLTIFGDGKQTRDFTYIDDCVTGTVAVLNAEHVIGETINIGGKARASVLDVINLLEKLMKQPLKRTYSGKAKGEPRRTWANLSKSEKLLDYAPVTTLESGLAKEIDDLIQFYKEQEL